MRFFIFTFCISVELGLSREGSTGFIDDDWIAPLRDDQSLSAHASAEV
jgi:hypothetical protein